MRAAFADLPAGAAAVDRELASAALRHLVGPDVPRDWPTKQYRAAVVSLRRRADPVLREDVVQTPAQGPSTAPNQVDVRRVGGDEVLSAYAVGSGTWVGLLVSEEGVVRLEIGTGGAPAVVVSSASWLRMRAGDGRVAVWDGEGRLALVDAARGELLSVLALSP